MRNGDRVVATPNDRDEIDLAALAEAVLSMLAARPTGTPDAPVSVPSAPPTTAATAGLTEPEEPAA